MHMQEPYEITVDRLSRTFDKEEFRSQLAALTVGSGSVAAILCRSDLAPPGRNHRLTGGVMRCASYAHDLCTARYDRMSTEPTLVLHGAHVIKQTFAAAQEALGWTPENIDVVVPHQVGKKCHRLGSSYSGVDIDKSVATYPYIGNAGPASTGIALSIAEKQGRIKEGMRVCLAAFGSGINCIMAEVMW